MVRPRKSASLHDHMDRNYTKSELQAMRQAEDDLKGKSEKVYDIPEHLSDLAQDYYKFIIDEMEVSGILSNLDIPLLSLTAETLAIIRGLEDEIQDKGLMIDTVNSRGVAERKKNPALDVRDKYTTQVKGLFTQLGMTPSSRASLAVANIEKSKQEEDPLQSLLNRTKKA